MTTPIPFVDLSAQHRRLGERIERAIQTVLDHGHFIMGPEVTQLEAALAERVGDVTVVTCSSGTDALLLPLMAWGIGPGDAVLVPSFTFPATPEVVALLGATPVFVDVDEQSFNLSVDPERGVPAGIRAARDAGLTPRVVIAVDMFGQPADYPSVAAAAAAEGLAVLADAAQSFGGGVGGAPVGHLAPVTATSFFPAKPLGCYGDGGAVFVDDPRLADVLRSIRVHGKGSDKYDIVRVGLNARLDTLQAAILLEKLTIFDDELSAREAIADRYTGQLEDVVLVPRVAADHTSAWAQYTIRVNDRDAVVAHLSSEGIPTAVYYPRPLHRQDAYARCPTAGPLPVAEQLAGEVLSLPFHPYLEPEPQQRVIDAVRRAIDRQDI